MENGLNKYETFAYLCFMTPLEILGFLKFSFTDILDVVLVALIIFFGLRWIRNSSAYNLFIAIILLYVINVVVEAFGMRLTSALFNTFLDVGVLALIVIFQPEIRRFLMKLGSRSNIETKSHNIINKIFGLEEKKLDSNTVNEVTEACRAMAAQKTGALIVFPHENELQNIIDTGDRIDANVNRRLIQNLFFKNSPLHDGAVIINGDRIVAARCTLPITQRTDLPPSFGMRHKAAVGISEESDASVIVVSEETGKISFARGGDVTTINNINELKLLLGAALSSDGDND